MLRDVTQPMIVLSRLEAVLRPTKRAVLDLKLTLRCPPGPSFTRAITPSGDALPSCHRGPHGAARKCAGPDATRQTTTTQPRPPRAWCSRETPFAPGCELSTDAIDQPSSRHHHPTANSRTIHRWLGRLRRTTALPDDDCPIARRTFTSSPVWRLRPSPDQETP